MDIIMKTKKATAKKALVNGEWMWLVDLSPAGDLVRMDCAWYFATRKEALRFLERVKAGVPAKEAYLMMD